jgi:hypothetical protein
MLVVVLDAVSFDGAQQRKLAKRIDTSNTFSCTAPCMYMPRQHDVDMESGVETTQMHYRARLTSCSIFCNIHCHQLVLRSILFLPTYYIMFLSVFTLKEN